MFRFDSVERECNATGEGDFPKDQVSQSRSGSRVFNKHPGVKVWLESLASGDTQYF